MNNISFGALKKSNASVKYNYNNIYIPYNTSIVELDKNDNKDFQSLYDLAHLWNEKYNGSFAYDILLEASKNKPNFDMFKEHYIALTTQENNFEKLDPEQILGVSMITEYDNSSEINWLQVKPDTKCIGNKNRKFKDIGKAIIDYIKSESSGRHIWLTSSIEAVDFYKKQHFKPRDGRFSKYIFCYNA
ncbi:hypothetical protein J6G99_06780 [bacterium]|nr:hypothetical protein [bacterium]